MKCYGSGTDFSRVNSSNAPQEPRLNSRKCLGMGGVKGFCGFRVSGLGVHFGVDYGIQYYNNG